MSSPHVLEIDAGNSALKWRVVQDNVLLNSGRLLIERNVQELVSALEQYLDLVSYARIVSVAGAAFNEKLETALQRAGVELVYFARVESERNGVRCGYKDLQQLGVDRWMAILAAAQEFSAPIVVVDAGSAINIELVNSKKEYVGGYIMPGWGLLYDSLVSGTAIPNERIPLDFEAGAINPGLNSEEAIGMARLLMCVSSINTVVKDFTASQGSSVQLVCTGGDSLKIMPHLRFDAKYRPDLVLDGLKVALG